MRYLMQCTNNALWDRPGRQLWRVFYSTPLVQFTPRRGEVIEIPTDSPSGCSTTKCPRDTALLGFYGSVSTAITLRDPLPSRLESWGVGRSPGHTYTEPADDSAEYFGILILPPIDTAHLIQPPHHIPSIDIGESQSSFSRLIRRSHPPFDIPDIKWRSQDLHKFCDFLCHILTLFLVPSPTWEGYSDDHSS